MRYITLTLICSILSLFAGLNETRAGIRTQDVEYTQGDIVLEGYLAFDNSLTGKRPGVFVVHDWTGLGPYVNMRCEQLAKLGYIAFAEDIYGKGVRPATHEDAGSDPSKGMAYNESADRRSWQAMMDFLGEIFK